MRSLRPGDMAEVHLQQAQLETRTMLTFVAVI